MAASTAFDVVIIGSGSAGFSAAESARALGAKVCLIEKEKLGGECPNWACVPTKALLRAARAFRGIRGAEAFGITASGAADFKRVMAYRKSAVETITGGGERGARYERLVHQLGVEVVFGEASFADAQSVEVGGRRVYGKSFVIATGATEFIPPVPGLADIHYLTSRDAVMLERQPKAVAIIGGGPVGCELATFYASFGTRVVLLQSAPAILNREDADIGRLAQEVLEARGVNVIISSQIVEVIDGRGGVYGLRVSSGGEEAMHAVEQVIVAAGKRANTDQLNLSAVGVTVDARGNATTNAQQATSARHVFAAGDVDGGMMFTHTAHHEGSIAGHNAALIALGKRRPLRKRDERVVPRVTFVEPEVASVGLTQEEARKASRKLLVARFPVAGLGRAITEHARQGLVKVIADPKSRKILGCHIMADRAGEMIHEAALAMHLNATVDDVASLIHAYPTWNEALAAACGSVTIE